MTVREQNEQTERLILGKNAALSAETHGRRTPEEPCPLRTEYQRDRDRILHCKAFRRLKHKTQVFLAPRGDHYTTRLTHTLEVAQIARTVARALQLNEDLTEAIALGHDLGHTPFGHSGEAVLNRLSQDGFAHYLQSLRVVDFIERDGRGLNLTQEVRDGIVSHTKGPQAKTAEGRLVRLCDKIAYVCHDIEDAKRAGVLREEELPASACGVLGRRKSARITALVKNVVENGDALLSGDTAAAFTELHRFMYQRVYLNPVSKNQEDKAMALLETLWNYFLQHTDRLPEEYQGIRDREGDMRAVCDYISGMTDNYAIWLFEELFVPALYVPGALGHNSWNKPDEPVWYDGVTPPPLDYDEPAPRGDEP